MAHGFVVGVLATLASAQVETAADPVADALRQLGLTPAQFRIHLADLDTFDTQPQRLTILDWILQRPLAAPLLAEFAETAFNIEKPADAVVALGQTSRWLSATVRRGLIGDPLTVARKASEQEGSLARAIERCCALGDHDAPRPTAEQIAEVCTPLPPDLSQALALLLNVMADAQEWSGKALRGRSAAEWRRLVAYLHRPSTENTVDEGPTPLADYDLFEEAMRAITTRPPAVGGGSFDVRFMFIGAEEILFAVNEIRPVLQRYSSEEAEPVELRLDTPLGRISIARTHEPHDDAPLLLIDLGGDDLYRAAGANASPTQRVSVAIDMAGDDRYVSLPPGPRTADGATTAGATTAGATAAGARSPSRTADASPGSFAAGTCGIGLLFDFAGNDLYECWSHGQASALFGVAVLYDEDGQDSYRVLTEHGQAAAQAGAALLIDRAGDDRYLGYSLVQGYGGPGGAAVLVDLSGNDIYEADDADIKYPSSQSREHNNSLAQGAGIGIRGDYREGLSACGGVGLLFDRAGDDRYSAGVFAQGVGYWFGLGMLIDLDGHDRYAAQWYAQGASAHFAAGILLDGGGNDHYSAPLNMAQGAGHDMGIGVLIERAGDDSYEAPNLGLGAGNAGGLGWFLDRSGDDRYQPRRGANLGAVTANEPGTLRAMMPPIGVFMDLAGDDTYPHDRAANGQTWFHSPDPRAGVLRGAGGGIDTDR